MKKLTVDTALLRKALQKLKPAISARTVLPILECVLLKVNKNALTLCATDCQLTIIHEMACEATGSFEMLLPYNELNNICGALPTCPLLIEQKGDLSTSLTAGDDVYKLGKMSDTGNFVQLPAFSKEDAVPVDHAFFSGLKQAAKTILDEKNEYLLNCVLIHFNGKELRIVSTDKCQLFIARLAIEKAITRKNSVYPEFIRALADVSEGELQVSEKFVCVKTDTTTYIGTCNDMKFVDYTVILKEHGEDFYTLAKKDFLLAIDKILAIPTAVYNTNMLISGANFKLFFRDDNYDREVTTHLVSADNDLLPASFRMDIKRLKVLLSQMPAEVEHVKMWLPDNKKMYVRPDSQDDDIECVLIGIAE